MPQPSQEPSQEASTRVPREPRLLVVEDDFLIRMTLVETLQDEGFAVLEAADADEAARLLREEAGIALLITDIQLPGRMDGWQLAAQARAALPGLRVIYMTGRPKPGGEMDPVFEAAVPKPYLPSDIHRATRRLLEG